MNTNHTDLIAKLRYMGKQYAAGQQARGGGNNGKHYLEEAADALEAMQADAARYRWMRDSAGWHVVAALFSSEWDAAIDSAMQVSGAPSSARYGASMIDRELLEAAAAGLKLQSALSRISYLCTEPNEMGVGPYDVHCDEDAVVGQVRALREQLAEALLDAERWRWWRANFGSIVVETEWRGGPAEGRYVRSVTLNPLFGPTDAASIDAAIDCAIAKQGDKIRPVR